MSRYTIELDQKTSAAINKAAAERSIPPEELVAVAAEWWLIDQAPEQNWSADDIAAIEEGIAQLERDESVPHDEVMAAMRAKYGA